MKSLLEGNQDWAQEMMRAHQEWFAEHNHAQHPEYLMITCCDSRIAPYLMTNTLPGRIFVVRTIGNIVNLKDTSTKAACDYAIKHLGIREAIICGHHDCGAIHAALNYEDLEEGPLKTHLSDLQYIGELPNGQEHYNQAAIFNINRQAEKLQQGYPELTIHKWYLNIPKGKFETL